MTFQGQPVDYPKKREGLYQEGEYQTFLHNMRKELDSLFEADQKGREMMKAWES